MRKWPLFRTGLFMGLAELVPGISATTVAFITGFYETLVEKIKSFKIKELFNVENIAFFLPLTMGMVISLLFFSRIFSFILSDPVLRTYLYCLFIGSFVKGINLLRSQIVVWNVSRFFFLCLGMVFSFLLAKSAGYAKASFFSFSYFDLYIILSSALAMLLALIPGISGGYIFLITGLYQPILHALSNLIFLDTNAIFCLLNVLVGLLIGLFLFAKTFSYLLHKHKEKVFTFFIGCFAASLFFIWPYSSTMHNAFGDEMPILTNQQLVISFTFLLAGFLFLHKIKKKPLHVK